MEEAIKIREQPQKLHLQIAAEQKITSYFPLLQYKISKGNQSALFHHKGGLTHCWEPLLHGRGGIVPRSDRDDSG